MKFKDERQFVNWLVAKLKIVADVMKVESTTSRGVPDLNLCLTVGREVWIECKLVVNGRVLIRPEQYAWGHRRASFGGHVFVFAAHPSGVLIWKYPEVRVDQHGKYLAINSAWVAQMGYHQESRTLTPLLFT
ncbi:vrR-nuC [Caudoviricetes sp.]|nr:vrR-nuC [Caudoviricetes sp.]